MESQQPEPRVEIEVTDWVTIRYFGGELVLLLVLGLSILWQRWRWRHSLSQQAERGSVVHQVLARILETCGADRVLLYEITGGGSRLNRDPCWRCLLTAAARRPGISAADAPEVPLGRLWAELEVLRDGKLRRFRVQGWGRPSDPRCTAYLLRQGVAEQWSQLLTWRGLPAALLAIQFRTHRPRSVPAALPGLISELEGALHGLGTPPVKTGALRELS